MRRAAVCSRGRRCILPWAEKPLTLAEGYVAAEGLTADITDGEGAVLSQPVRGTKVTYVVEDEDKDHPGLVRLVLGEDSFGYLAVSIW